MNVSSTQKLLDFAVKNGVKKFVYTSSGGVYGFGKETFLEENEIKIDYYLLNELLCMFKVTD